MFVHDRLFCVFCIFFFKQKTAYEMRISDWSSDVCSSDLRRCPEAVEPEVWRGRLAGLGIDIGPAFAGIRRLWRGDDEALAEVRLPDGMTSGAASMHPALPDACLQVAGRPITGAAPGEALLPNGIERVRLPRDARGGAWGWGQGR